MLKFYRIFNNLLIVYFENKSYSKILLVNYVKKSKP
ncbi:hypothetical protein SAMN05428975_0127 [Mucilaginibacter sp. OK268]|nr:hypothetical protein SAMN05428975_0127 [Mucilaginibacter sp. OK268]